MFDACQMKSCVDVTIVDDLIGRAGASPPSRATGLNFLYF